MDKNVTRSQLGGRFAGISWRYTKFVLFAFEWYKNCHKKILKKFIAKTWHLNAIPTPGLQISLHQAKKRQLLIEMFSFAVQQWVLPQALFINNTCTWKTSTALSRPCYTVAIWPLIENNFSLFNPAQYVVHCIREKAWEGHPINALCCDCLRRLCCRYSLNSLLCPTQFYIFV